MSDRILKILLAVLAVLALGWVGARFVSGRGRPPESAAFDLASTASLDLDSVVITSATDTIRLIAGDGWTVNGYEAVGAAGESLTRALENARVGQLASRNPANHDRLSVSETTGRRLTFYADGSERLSLFIGGKRTFEQGYVRRAGDDEVYVIRGSLLNLADRSASEWRNKEILSVERDDIWRVEYAYTDAEFALQRDTAGWRLEPAEAVADEGAVSSLLGQLSSLRALGFVADSVVDTLTWEPGAGRVRVSGPGDATLGELEFYRREDTGYYVRRAGAPVVYTLSSYTGEQILQDEEALSISEEEAQEE